MEISNYVSIGALLVSLAAFLFSWQTYRIQKHNALCENRRQFYLMARKIILSRLKTQFWSVIDHRYQFNESINEVRMDNEDLFEDPRSGGKKIMTIEDLATQSEQLFPKEISQYFLNLKNQELSQSDFKELEKSEYLNWFYKKFKPYIDVR